MKSLDTYIQEKLEEFIEKYRKTFVHGGFMSIRDYPPYEWVMEMEYVSKFLEALIRTTARETLEAVKDIPLEYAKKTCVFKDERYFIVYEGDFKAMSTAILSAAKERGIIN